MGQTVTAAVTVPRSASSSLRFLGLLKQPTDSDQNPNPSPSLTCPLELDERDDVFWSPPSSSSSPAAGGSRSASHLGRGGGGRPRPFVSEPRGLSAALGDDGGGGGGAPVRRLSAARVTRPVPVPGAAATAVEEGVLRLRQSAPVVVPAWPKRTRVRREKRERGEEEEEEEEEIEEDEEEGMVPPHVMVGRAHAHAMTSSVVEGAGRTLKGRDLRRVRNAVLERTGFLD